MAPTFRARIAAELLGHDSSTCSKVLVEISRDRRHNRRRRRADAGESLTGALIAWADRPMFRTKTQPRGDASRQARDQAGINMTSGGAGFDGRSGLQC